MKYFANIKTAEELRKVYRELCLTLHPDRGGNEEDFKAMQAEFESMKADFTNGTAGTSYTHTTHTETAEERRQREEEERREREEWARWEEEQRKAREEEERRERERIEKAQEENRRKIAEWAARLERVNNAHKRTWDFTDKKAAAAYVAATKRNIKAVINHYFPGLNVKIKISGQIWKENFEIVWEDGPSVAEMKEIEELYYFVPSHYVSDPYADYGDYKSNEGTAPWREAYGQALGDCTDIDFTRTLSEEGTKQAEEIAARVFANWNNDDPRGTFAATLTEWVNFAVEMGAKRNEWGSVDLYKMGMSWGQFANNERREDGHDVGDFYFSSVRRLLRECAPVNVTPKEKAPEFVPTYGPAFKAIKKVMGGNAFCIYSKKHENNKEINVIEAAEMLARGESVTIGKFYIFDGKKYVSGLSRGGYKTQTKRAEKYAAAGIILEGTSFNTYGAVQAVGINPDTLEALRREAADIEKQRKAWEASQNGDKSAEKADKGTKDNETTDNTTTGTNSDRQSARNDADMSEAPADGLQLVEIAGGVAVVGDSRTTYKNRKAIKAHGARWNRDAQQWQATDPADVATLRAWFGMSDTDKTNDTDNESDTVAQNAPESTQTGEADNTTTDTPESDQSAQDTPESESTGNAAPAADLSPLVEAFANLFRIIADTMQEAKKYDGVTIPADTLERWRTETATGTKCAAAQLSEVCACLGCLTPDSRREFDALGVIFWTLAEQLRQGFNPESIAPATDYARGQLFDLIDRTQTANQAAAVREATDRRDAA